MPITLDGTLGVGTPGITLAGGAITANANQLNNSAEDVNSENRIINGDMGVWQRGTSGATSGYVAADRWLNAFIGGTGTQSRQGFALGDSLGATQPTYFLRQTVSGQTLAAHYAQTVQRIEGVRSYAGQTITVMGWAKVASGTANMAVEGAQEFGTGGSPSATVTSINPTTVSLGAAWAPFAVVMNIPSITGKTLGANGNDRLALAFWTSAGSDWNARTNSLGLQTIGVDLWGIHIRVGTWTAADAALYRPRDPGTELALCQRYFFGPYTLDMLGRGYDAAEGLRINLLWPTAMRATPSFTLSTNTGGVVVVATTFPSPLGTGFSCKRAGSDQIYGSLTFTADAEL